MVSSLLRDVAGGYIHDLAPIVHIIPKTFKLRPLTLNFFRIFAERIQNTILYEQFFGA